MTKSAENELFNLQYLELGDERLEIVLQHHDSILHSRLWDILWAVPDSDGRMTFQINTAAYWSPFNVQNS